ncbi:hypothetical protein V5799_012485 [Amblyomma americanum]|uniref:Lipocalin n=1 Tax=Amblyomma americanum TaxID=6943 RepID=A0AAQ4EEB6_AMBAM
MSVNISCMSSTTVSKDNDTHTLRQLVRFYNWNTTSWITGYQNLTAYNDSEGLYNFMNTTETLGRVNTSYLFLYTEQNCSVVQVTYLFGNATSSSMEPQKDGTLFTSCMLWVRDGDLKGDHTCCEEIFTNNCTGPVYDVYNETECNALQPKK